MLSSFLGVLPILIQTRSSYVAQAGIKLITLLPQLPKWWDYRCVPLHSVCHRLFLCVAVLGFVDTGA
jgi:hypothetical protein